MNTLLVDEWPGVTPICGSGLGSTLLKLPAMHDAADAGWNVHVLTSEPKSHLLHNAPAVTRCHTEPSTVSWNDIDRVVPLGLQLPTTLDPRLNVHADPRSPADIKQHYDRLPHVTFWRQHISARLDLPPPDGPASMHLRVPDDARTWAGKTLPTGELIAMSLSALTNLKRYVAWPHAAGALTRLRPDCHIALVGMEPPADGFPPSTIDLTRRTSIPQLMGLLDRADVVVGTDGLVTNLALALQRPVVSLFTIIRPDFVFADELQTTSPVTPLVHEGCPMQFCYDRLGNYRTAQCPAQTNLPHDATPACARFDPERVAEAVVRLLPKPAQ